MKTRYIVLAVAIVVLLSSTGSALAYNSSPSAFMAAVFSQETALALLAALLGTVARTLFPFLIVLRDNPGTKFDRQFLVPALMSFLISVVTFPMIVTQLPAELIETQNMTAVIFSMIFAAAWGLTDIAREGQKVVLPSQKEPRIIG